MVSRSLIILMIVCAAALAFYIGKKSIKPCTCSPSKQMNMVQQHEQVVDSPSRLSNNPKYMYGRYSGIM